MVNQIPVLSESSMVRRMLTYTMLLALSAPSLAEEPPSDAEEFLLGDLGVRIDLPSGPWRMTRWSDWDFKAEYESARGKILLWAWATPVQIPIAEDATGWGRVYLAKIDKLSGTGAEVLESKVDKVAGRDVAFVDVAFQFGDDGPKGLMYGATIEIGGQNMHLAAVASEANQKELAAQRAALVERLDVRSLPAKTAFGGEVTASGITSVLPRSWRPPFEDEIPVVVVPAMKKLGVDDLEGCWSAIRPDPAGVHGVMITCQGGLELGVVDEHSFAGVDERLRGTLFGGVDVPPAEMVSLDDRVGFAYQAADGLAVGVVPYDKGVARTWLLDAGEPLTDLKSTLASSTYSGPHQVGPTDWLTYYAVHRPTSPVSLGVLGGALVVVLGLGALVVGRSGRNKYADFDED